MYISQQELITFRRRPGGVIFGPCRCFSFAVSPLPNWTRRGGASTTECHQLCPQCLPTILAAGSNLRGTLREPLPLRPRTFNTRCALSFLIGCEINIIALRIKPANQQRALRKPSWCFARTSATPRANHRNGAREPSCAFARTIAVCCAHPVQHTCTRLYAAVYSCTQLHTAIHSCTQLYTAVHCCTHMCTQLHIHVHTAAHTCTHSCTYMSTQLHIHVHAAAHTCVHSCIYTRTHAHA